MGVATSSTPPPYWPSAFAAAEQPFGRWGPKPPSWNRVAKRALIFIPVILLLTFAVGKNQPVSQKAITALIFIAIFVPFSYWMDATTWRSYQKRMAKQKGEKKPDAKSSGKPGGRGRKGR